MQTPLFVVLAGGIGKNFAPLVTNKTVFPFFGRPLIAHTLEMIRAAGGREALVICNQENQEAIQNLNSKYLKIQTVIQKEALGQADALRLIVPLVGERPILIVNSVDLIDPTALRAFLKQAPKTYAQILGMKVHEYFLGGYLKIEGERVTDVVEKPAPGTEPSDIANLFFHYFRQPQALFELIKKEGERDDAYELALAKLMKKEKVSFMAYDGYWQKLKQAHHVLDMTKLLLNTKLKRHLDRRAQIDRSAKIEGKVYIEAGAQILAGAVIKGPAYIGHNVIVGNHTLIRDSIVEANSVIGFGSEVARSYIGPNCSLHHNFIGDSILEAEVNPSYGTCTANLRFDGTKVKMRLAVPGAADQLIETNKDKLGAVIARGAFLGVNCSILPGISIGAKATAYPASVINRAVLSKGNFGK
jgi:UDP-N-acetylglucosamine diphosphorylase / glucose-1-phosphate thymidylyltransferase / UDP-N-acetylgalactosamine diphosphorylase / glucosamine-1-phosphate N-acetyltransferase / galactosamine-1-phosphate N-acetyltransferase